MLRREIPEGFEQKPGTRSRRVADQAIDRDTGKRVAHWEFPDDSVLYNTWGGITVFLEDGDFLLGGFFALKRFNTSDLR